MMLCSPRLYEETEGDYYADFIEDHCRHDLTSFAARSGDPIELRAWQRSIFQDLYELKPDRNRRYRKGLIGIPKKNAKSFLLSGIAVCALVADTDEPNADIVVVAATKDQAKIVFQRAKHFIEASPFLSARCDIYRDSIHCVDTGSVLRVITNDADTQDGLNPYLVIFDEVHRQPDSELWDVMVNGIGTRPNAMVLGITTAGFDRESLCYRLYDYGKRLASGELDDPSFFFRWWEPSDPNCDHLDQSVWQECNPGLADFMSLEDLRQVAQSTPENDFRRLRLNQWTSNQDTWINPDKWRCLEDKTKKVEEGASVIIGFDGSWANDSTGLVGVDLEQRHVFVVDAWEKPTNGPDDWRVDVADVEDAVRAAAKRYKVLEFVCDPKGWERSLSILSNENLPMVELANVPVNMIRATKSFETGIYEASLSHDGDPRLTRHLENCVVKTDRMSDAHYMTKQNRAPSNRIDLAVCAVMAWDRACHHWAKPPKKPFYVNVI